MAHAALLSLARLVDEITPHEQDYTSLGGKDQMISLRQNIISLQNFLQVVPCNYASMSTTQLESRLTHVIYRLEDLIESNLTGSPCGSIRVAAADATLLPSMFCRSIEEISSIVQEAKEMEELFKQNMKAAPALDSQSSSSSIDEPGSNEVKVGLNEDLQKIIERVTSREKSLQIIPVVGMGGIGKTTLARAVYEDPEIRNHFDVCFWVTVSQEYNIQEILKGFLEVEIQTAESLSVQKNPTEGNSGLSLSNKKVAKGAYDPLDARVHKRLRNRRFLIVMDDMWDEKAWQGILSAIPKDQTSSRIILTTRSSDVAEKVNSSSSQHQMHFLDKETSWNLLRKKVYGLESCPPEFEYLGRRIAANCDGLPLTIVVVGGLLESNMTKDYWEEVERNINEATTRDERLVAVLSLSYNNLPNQLKSCFLYMGAFPEDFRIPTSDLFCLWVAQGFIKAQASKRLEEIAEEYLEDLVKRNLVLVDAKRSDGKIRTCSIHDVPRELGLRKAKEDNFLQRFIGPLIDDITLGNITTSQRHVSVSAKRFNRSSNMCNTFIRSLLFIHCPASLQLSLVASRFKLLKVLYGVRATSEFVLRQIFELTNLRLLHFTCYNDGFGGTVVVPNSISKLQKLETLIVAKGSRLSIPVDIWKIPKLRHMVMPKDDCTLLFPVFSQGYPVLEHLQTLSWAKGARSTKYVVRRIQNLKKLKIYDSHDRLVNFGDLCELENLTLNFCGWKNIVFPDSIKKLSLYGCGFLWEDLSSIVGSLPNLQVLKLRKWDNEPGTWEPTEGDFLQLKYLKIDSNLKQWSADSTHFPCLEKLVMVDIWDLEEIPLDIGYIPTLHKLILNRCWSKVNESAERIREEQKSVENDLLQVVITNRRGW